jgi:hypothetical protein
LVLVKEDLGMTVAAIGVVLAWRGPRKWGVGLAVFGLVSFVLTMAVLIPHFNSGGVSGFARLGAEPTAGVSVLDSLFRLTVDVVTPGPRLTTVLMLLVVTGFMALASPLVIVALPTLAWRFISSNQSFWGQDFHYDLVLMPILFAALIDGVVRARRARWQSLRWYARAAPALALALGLFFCTRFAFRDLVDPATYRPSPRAVTAQRILSAIPDGATVESDIGLLSQLTQRTRVFFVGSAAPVVPQFVLIDDTAGWNPPIPDPVKYAESLHPKTVYVRVMGGDGFTLVQRVR